MSVASAGAQSNGASVGEAVSAGGALIVFTSNATDLGRHVRPRYVRRRREGRVRERRAEPRPRRPQPRGRRLRARPPGGGDPARQPLDVGRAGQRPKRFRSDLGRRPFRGVPVVCDRPRPGRSQRPCRRLRARPAHRPHAARQPLGHGRVRQRPELPGGDLAARPLRRLRRRLIRHRPGHASRPDGRLRARHGAARHHPRQPPTGASSSSTARRGTSSPATRTAPRMSSWPTGSRTPWCG